MSDFETEQYITRLESSLNQNDKRIAELERGINAATDAHDIAETQNESLKEIIERLRGALKEIADAYPHENIEGSWAGDRAKAALTALEDK